MDSFINCTSDHECYTDISDIKLGSYMHLTSDFSLRIGGKHDFKHFILC